MTKIATILGARPQFIKASVVSRALRSTAGVQEILIHTGQHFDPEMSDIFFKELDIPLPDHHLGISGGGHGAMTGTMLQKLEPLLQDIAPDWVLVYGDTNSTLAGALAAAKLHIPVAHVEAGLRSYNRFMPEEINRVLTDHCADLLFTPTDTATKNLLQEGLSAERIKQVGDVMFDAALHYGLIAENQSRILRRAGLELGKYILATIHRQENTDDRFQLLSIFEALQEVARKIPVVLPLHPRTRKRLAEFEFEFLTKDLHILPPQGYLDMIMLQRSAAVIVTDSGGVQKEAYFFKIPCVTLRDETEWVELVELGWNRLAPPGTCDIPEKVFSAIGTQGTEASPYGSGKAAEKIRDCL